MRLRYWLMNALTGHVVRELTHVSEASHSTRLDDRGRLTLRMSLEAVGRDGALPDWPEVRRRAADRAPLMHTIAVSHPNGIDVLAEYVVESWEGSTASGEVSVTGFSWERYPAYRSLHRDHIHKSVGRGVVARDLLIGAYLDHNAGLLMSIPTTAPSGTITLERKQRTYYYSDALSEVMGADPGGEWIMGLSGDWSGGLRTVIRTVVWGWPRVVRSTPIELIAGGAGTRHGNCVLSGGEDGNRYAQSVYAVGPGQGDKQPVVGLSDPTRTNAGSLNATKNLSLGNIDKPATLTAMARQALTEAQSLARPWRITAQVDRLAAVPRVGDTVYLRAGSTWAWPDGINTAVRVGEVSWSTKGGIAETIDLLVADGMW